MSTSWRANLQAQFEARKKVMGFTELLPAVKSKPRRVKQRPPFYSSAPAVGTIISVRVCGEPKGQPRQRSRIVKPKGRPPFIQFYDPHDADEWKADVKRAFGEHAGRAPIEGLVRFSIDVLLPRPKYLCSPWYTQHAAGEIPARCKPDVDNTIKAAMDALTDYGIWRDDAQVTRANVAKFYHAIGQVPGARITLEVLPDIPSPPKRQAAEPTPLLFA